MTKVEEMEFEMEQLKKAMTDTHSLARKYEDLMTEANERRDKFQEKCNMLQADLDFCQEILGKARAAAVSRVLDLKAPELWRYVTEACMELTGATSGYAAKVVNLGAHAGSSTKRVNLLTLDLLDTKQPEPHFRYIAASKDDRFMVDRIMLQGQGVSFALTDGNEEVDIPDVTANRDMFFFRGDLMKGSFFGVPVSYLGKQVVGMLCMDSCGGEDVLVRERHVIQEDEKTFVRQMRLALQDAIAEDEKETEARMDPTARMLQILGTMHESRWDQAKQDMVQVLETMGDTNQFRPSDMGHLRSLNIPPKHSLNVIRASFHLLGTHENEFEQWQNARALLNQKYVENMIALRPEQVKSMVSRWKLALLELQHVNRSRVEEESSCAMIIYKWILALRAATCVHLLKHKQIKDSMSKKNLNA
mmetsp:Transcript_22915/g.63608  ORF Transcript_22915/g.63608 Transcript_22915/m.63608 type:complete len:418 (+) Transcript_22915:1501-2754(+)